MKYCCTIEDLVECFWVLSFDRDFVWDVDRVRLEIVELLVQSEGFRHPVLAARGRKSEPLEGEECRGVCERCEGGRETLKSEQTMSLSCPAKPQEAREIWWQRTCWLVVILYVDWSRYKR